MTNLHSVEAGTCAWMDDQIMHKCTGLNKWLMGIAVVQMPGIIERMYNQHKGMLMDMQIATEDDRIDLDRAEKMLIDVADRYGKVEQNIAGTKVSLDKEDVVSLASFIRRV